MVTAGALYAVSRSMPFAVTTAVSGSLYDADHIFDLLRNPEIKPTLKDMLTKSKVIRERNKYYAPMHSYEFVILLALAFFSFPSPALLGIYAGALLHLVTDILSNHPYPYAYFFASRLLRNFNKSELFGE